MAISALLLGASIASAGPLFTTQTRHYRVLSDLDPELTQDCAVRLDAMYDEYARRFSGFKAPSDATMPDVYLLSKRRDYDKLTENRLTNTGGVYISSRHTIAAYLEGQGRDALRKTLQHEAFHEFAYHIFGPQLPIWLNEGIAQVFEEAIWSGRSFSIGQIPPRRLRQLTDEIATGHLTRFEAFLQIDERQWSAGMRERTLGSARYNQAWAMAHMLIFAADETGEPLYRERLLQMLRSIHDGCRAEKAFAGAFGDNLDGFQQRFLAYYSDAKPTSGAAAIERQRILADMLTGLEEKQLTFDDINEFRACVIARQVRLNYSNGGISWSTNENPAIYFTDAAGQSLIPDRMYFQSRTNAPIPDLVTIDRCGFRLTTRFRRAADQIEHEVLAEAR